MLHDYGEYRENVIMPNVKKYTLADVKSFLNTVGAVATRTHKTHFPDIRSVSTSTYATRGYQCGMCSYLAIHGGRSISKSTEQAFCTCTRSLTAPHSPVNDCIWCSYTPYNRVSLFVIPEYLIPRPIEKIPPRC